MTDLQSSTVLITGAASGIGRQMANRFAARGATVVIWDLNLEGAQSVAKDLQTTSGRTHHAYRVDVTDRAAVYAAADQARADVGGVDVVVNNAGVVSGSAPLVDTPDELIELTFRVNTLSLFWVTKAFLPQMIERDRGHVVTIASASGLLGVSRLVEYASSKHAAVGFDESLRMELAEIAPGVRTTVVNPFFIDTGMFEGVRSKVPWLLPILKEADVAKAVVSAVEADRPQVNLPWSVSLLSPARVLPVRAFDAVINLLGVNDTMKTFHGRRPAPVEAAEVAQAVGESLHEPTLENAEV